MTAHGRTDAAADARNARGSPGVGGRCTVPGAVRGCAGRHGGRDGFAVDAGRPARTAVLGQSDRHGLRHVLRRPADAGRAAGRPVRSSPDDSREPGGVRGGCGGDRRGRLGGLADGGAVPAGRGRRGVGAGGAAAADDGHRRGPGPAPGDRHVERGRRGGGGQRLCRRRGGDRPDELAVYLLGLPAAGRRTGGGHRELGAGRP
jgi:hypothetical protein